MGQEKNEVSEVYLEFSMHMRLKRYIQFKSLQENLLTVTAFFFSKIFYFDLHFFSLSRFLCSYIFCYDSRDDC